MNPDTPQQATPQQTLADILVNRLWEPLRYIRPDQNGNCFGFFFNRNKPAEAGYRYVIFAVSQGDDSRAIAAAANLGKEQRPHVSLQLLKSNKAVLTYDGDWSKYSGGPVRPVIAMDLVQGDVKSFAALQEQMKKAAVAIISFSQGAASASFYERVVAENNRKKPLWVAGADQAGNPVIKSGLSGTAATSFQGKKPDQPDNGKPSNAAPPADKKGGPKPS